MRLLRHRAAAHAPDEAVNRPHDAVPQPLAARGDALVAAAAQVLDARLDATAGQAHPVVPDAAQYRVAGRRLATIISRMEALRRHACDGYSILYFNLLSKWKL